VKPVAHDVGVALYRFDGKLPLFRNAAIDDLRFVGLRRPN
jgi:hypothetical protein